MLASRACAVDEQDLTSNTGLSMLERWMFLTGDTGDSKRVLPCESISLLILTVLRVPQQFPPIVEEVQGGYVVKQRSLVHYPYRHERCVSLQRSFDTPVRL
jgi:hypothetical protein